MRGLTPGRCAQLACELEVAAPKAGNVHRGRDFADLSYDEFMRSAAAIAPAMDAAPARALGETVLDAVRRTRAVVATNTNLGMVLCLAPLARAFDAADLRAAVARELAATTVADAALVYEAIRLAAPGGLGEAPQEDVREAPTLALVDVMSLAADRDLVARQYARDFADVFELGAPALERALAAGRSRDDAIVGCHLQLIAALGDSLIARKLGAAASREASERARTVLDAGWPDAAAGRAAFDSLDDWLRADGNRRNPGATADLVAACIFVALRGGALR